jgi:hypothetical protein
MFYLFCLGLDLTRPIYLVLHAWWRISYVLLLRSEPCAIGIEVVWGISLVLKGSIATAHAITAVVGSLHWAASSHVVVRGVAGHRLRVAQARAARGLTDFHPWRKCVLQEDAAILARSSIF